MDKVPPVILVPYGSGKALFKYAQEHSLKDERAILFVDFDMVTFKSQKSRFLIFWLAEVRHYPSA